MEKLIKLLNEYEKRKGEEYGRGNYVWGIDKENKNIFASRFPDGVYICEEESRAIIICKGYEFIKWLFDEDKIDTRAQVIKDVETWGSEIKDVVCYDGYESLLMLLSISDNPIEFLVSILR